MSECADFKSVVIENEKLNPRVLARVVKVVTLHMETRTV